MADSNPSISSRLAGLNPFSKGSRQAENEDLGEEMGSNSVAGGGHAARRTDITKTQLIVSPALKAFIAEKGILPQDEIETDSEGSSPALQALVDRPHINVPEELTDRSYPLAEYFISSSHNTYLMAHQLYGSSSAAAYEVALSAGARCVEIDAWDGEENKDEPKVTHGYTLVSNISFRSVCETIRDVVDKEAAESVNTQGYRAAPIILSLENHCDTHGQLLLVQIMEEVWGDRLLSKATRQKGHDEQEGKPDVVTLDELGSKIVVIVEYHLPNEVEDSDSDSSSDEEDEKKKRARLEYKEKQKAAPPAIIIPELAAVGVYAQSVKPVDNSWFEGPELRNSPHHHLINVSEVGLMAHLPAHAEHISRHNAEHLMRVFPKGTRISSQNLNPVPFWGLGAQICALNWQTFAAAMQINEALFSGSDGFVLKPAALRPGGSGRLSTGRKKKLRLLVAGASDVPLPEGREADGIKPYVTCTLVHPADVSDSPPKRKTGSYKQRKLDFLHKGVNSPVTDPVWDETLEWEYEDNELVFLRVLIKSEDKFAGNPVLVAAAVRVLYAVKDWVIIRMLDLKGRETKCSLLVKFEVEDV
ncbi:PLC-like phosphodiesterase [Tothia fuscella]|uniref:Phosphoinositide phospholipase C n=1 Tax=Tothia fuscella TaxID=1048955 RepID=A0A9P4NGB9_9PEZI|nr:PLC-like phosphodiesterase [Tothia fuscella]